MPMLIVTTDDVPGREIAETLGLASGWGRASPGLSGNAGGGYRRTDDYHVQSRDAALAALAEEAEEMGADAIVALRFSVVDDIGPACHFFAFGTAVKLV